MHLPVSAIVCAEELGGSPPEWVRLMPLGKMQAVDGRAWTLAAADAEAVIEASRAIGIDLVIDLDHATDQKGAAAPAAGWIKELAVRDGHIAGRVEWTELGRAKLTSREYRYLSPAFLAPLGKVTRILRASLVNAPALPQLGALAAAQPGVSDVTDLTVIAKAAGLAETAAATDVAARVSALQAEAGSVRQALALAADAATDAVVAAIARRPSAEDHAQLASRLSALETQDKARRVSAAVDAAMQAGKLAPAQKTWATQYASADLAGFEAYAAAAPVIVAPGKRADLGKSPGKGDALDDVEQQVCSAFGLQPSAFVKARAEMEAVA